MSSKIPNATSGGRGGACAAGPLAIESVIAGRKVTFDFNRAEKSYQGAHFIPYTASTAMIDATLVFNPHSGKFNTNTFVIKDAELAAKLKQYAAAILQTLRDTAHPSYIPTDVLRAPVLCDSDGSESLVSLRVPVQNTNLYVDRDTRAVCAITAERLNEIAPRGSEIRAQIRFDTLVMSKDANRGLSLRAEVVCFSVVKRGDPHALQISDESLAFLCQ